MALSRLDKILSQSGERTRSEASRLIRAGLVSVDGVVVVNPAHKADAARSAVVCRGERIRDLPFQYAAVHKPAGMLTAARDRGADTVMRLLPKAMRARDVMPVGRLDKDTTGLLLFTNDGTLAHRLLSPKTHVWKEYLATVDGLLTPETEDAFTRGIPLHDFTALPAALRIVSAATGESRAVVTLREGKYHQVKRMFRALGFTVTALHRQAFGPLTLDIPSGGCRPLTEAEITALYTTARMDREGRHG